MKIEDVKITADTKQNRQTPELNEDGTPKVIEETPAPEQKEIKKDDDQEDIGDEHTGDEGEEDDEELNEDGTPKEKIPAVVPVVEKPAVPDVDYKKKFGDSTRRNQIVESQFRELQKVLGDITRQEIPSDEEMKAIDPDWEYRSDFEKNLSVKVVVQERRQNQILSTIGNITKESELADEIVSFIDKTPELEGKDAEFYNFVTDPKNRGASMEVLLGAFLHKEGITPKAPVAPQDPTPEERAPSLNRSTPRGGNPPKEIKTGYSDSELKELRTKDPKKYFKMIRDKKI